MPDVQRKLETRAHPASQHQWYLTTEALGALCGSIIGKPVRVNFTGDPVGHVVDAKLDEIGAVQITMEIADPTVARFAADNEKYVLAPALHNPNQIGVPPAGEIAMGPEWAPSMVGVIPKPPEQPREERIVGTPLQGGA